MEGDLGIVIKAITDQWMKAFEEFSAEVDRFVGVGPNFGAQLQLLKIAKLLTSIQDSTESDLLKPLNQQWIELARHGFTPEESEEILLKPWVDRNDPAGLMSQIGLEPSEYLTWGEMQSTAIERVEQLGELLADGIEGVGYWLVGLAEKFRP